MKGGRAGSFRTWGGARNDNIAIVKAIEEKAQKMGNQN